MAKAKKRKVTRRSSASRRGRRKPLPTWAWVLIGLVVGVTLTALVQLVIKRTTAPNSGLRALVDAAKHAHPAPAKPATPPARSTRKTKYDFYTILPETETVLPEPSASPAPAEQKDQAEPGYNYILQVGSFNQFADADRLKARLALNGLVAKVEKTDIKGKGTYYRVRLGPYNSLSALDRAHKRIQQLNMPALRLKVKNG